MEMVLVQWEELLGFFGCIGDCGFVYSLPVSVDASSDSEQGIEEKYRSRPGSTPLVFPDRHPSSLLTWTFSHLQHLSSPLLQQEVRCSEGGVS